MFLSPLACPVFGGVSAPVEFLGRAHEPLMFQVAGEDVAHLLGSGLVDEYASARRIDVVTQYWTTAYPTPLLACCGHLVTGTLSNDLSFELGEGKQDIERQATHRMGRIELLRY